ncbi:MAG: hypothetical protein OQK82_03260 [Candidatus Pacearchaeota archaeon]|nr:hypothetical protein [Candidatus Pacearchaeota archaeon]
MANETILQHWIFTQFILPFLLMWTIVFAVLQRSRLLGEGRHQLDAVVAFVIGLIFVSAVFPKVVVGNLILFLTVAIIVMFVGLLLWGFVSGGDLKGEIVGGRLKPVVAGVIVVVIIVAVLWATGVNDEVGNILFNQSWSSSFWTNVSFIAIVAGALAAVLIGGGKAANG